MEPTSERDKQFKNVLTAGMTASQLKIYRLDITIAVNWDVKPQNQTTKNNYVAHTRKFNLLLPYFDTNTLGHTKPKYMYISDTCICAGNKVIISRKPEVQSIIFKKCNPPDFKFYH